MQSSRGLWVGVFVRKCQIFPVALSATRVRNYPFTPPVMDTDWFSLFGCRTSVRISVAGGCVTETVCQGIDCIRRR